MSYFLSCRYSRHGCIWNTAPYTSQKAELVQLSGVFVRQDICRQFADKMMLLDDDYGPGCAAIWVQEEEVSF